MSNMTKQPRQANRALVLLVLHVGVLISSLSGVCLKLAATEARFSMRWIMLYCGAVASLGIYAILWQQVLKRMSLISAFLNRSVKVLWAMLWGLLLFHERLSWNMLLGVAIVLAGVIVMVYADEE